MPEIYSGGGIFSEGIPTAARQSACQALTRTGAARPDADPRRPSKRNRSRLPLAWSSDRVLSPGLLLWVDCDNHRAIEIDKKDHRRFI